MRVRKLKDEEVVAGGQETKLPEQVAKHLKAAYEMLQDRLIWCSFCICFNFTLFMLSILKFYSLVKSPPVIYSVIVISLIFLVLILFLWKSWKIGLNMSLKLKYKPALMDKTLLPRIKKFTAYLIKYAAFIIFFGLFFWFFVWEGQLNIIRLALLISFILYIAGLYLLSGFAGLNSLVKKYILTVN
jgi:hypothetical protein